MVETWTGPHAVGVCDIEWASDGLKNVTADAIDPSKHVVGRLFYPCDAAAEAPGGGKPPKRGVPWLSRHQEATGYVGFIFFAKSSWGTAILKLLLRAALWVLGKWVQRLPLFQGAAVHVEHGPHPVIVFSHGLGGNRGTYAVLCAELASQGFVVLALEHTDGSASSTRLAGSGGWQYYGGLGQGEAKYAKVRWRQLELSAAQQLLGALHAGAVDEAHCKISGGIEAASFLRGKLDMARLAAVGHSFGGATVGAAAAKCPDIRASVALDPWWLGVPPEEPALKAFRTRTPLLVIGSHAWNKPYNDAGDIVCGRTEQAAVLAAASAAGEGGEPGGGALLLTIANSTHDTFSDLPVLFATRFSWLLSRLGFKTELDPVTGMAAVAGTTALFLHLHLPTARPPAQAAALPGSRSSFLLAQQQQLPASCAAGSLHASDSGWSLVSAGDANSGASVGGPAAPEGPSEATRADAANAGRVGLSGSNTSDGGSNGGGTLDPAVGAEATGRTGAQAHGGCGGGSSSSGKSGEPGGGGVMMPSAAELAAIGADASGGGTAIATEGRSCAGVDQRRRSAAEAGKIAVSKDTKESVAALLGGLAAILELHT